MPPPPPPSLPLRPSPSTPHVSSIPSGCTVHSRLLTISGTCGSSSGTLFACSHHYSFPSIPFPVHSGSFTAILHLSPGLNNCQLLFRDSHNYDHDTTFIVTYVPLLQNPPLHLCILVGSDSPLVYDDVPDCSEPNNLDTAIKKFRLAGYLWQAYTGAEMYRQGLGYRTFRLDEAWQPDSLTSADSVYRNTAKITVLRSKYTTAFIRDPERAQQNKKKKGEETKGLFSITLEALEDAFPGPKNHIACMILDAHYHKGLIQGHAALGGGTAQHSLAIFGSHSLFSWPSYMENIVPAFNDTRPVNTKYCGVDVEGKTYWIAANVGIGAFMHEVGHLFGCPHQENGVMRRDYTRLNKSFCCGEPPDGVKGGLCTWHRLDALRFRCHPSFALPEDMFTPGGISVLGVENALSISAPGGIGFCEFFVDGKEFPVAHLEWAKDPPKSHILPLSYLHEIKHDFSKIRVQIFSANGTKYELKDIPSLLSTRHDPRLGIVHRTQTFGLQGGEKQHILIPYPLRLIRVHCGAALDGIEFFQAGTNHSVLFGKRGGHPEDVAVGESETIVGFSVRHGAWLDALQPMMPTRRGPWLGNAEGGGPGEVVVPNGWRVCGVFGEVGGWVMKMGLEYCRN